jgi:hypothetical protein
MILGNDLTEKVVPMLYPTKTKKPLRISERLDFTGVGVARFELATSCSQSRRDNRATLHPEGALFSPGCNNSRLNGITPTTLRRLNNEK